MPKRRRDKARFIVHIQLPMDGEEKLSEKEKKDIELHIRPEYTGWRDKLVFFLPNLLSSSKFSSHIFLKPVKNFLRIHNMLNSDNVLHINTRSNDRAHLRLLYRLWLFIKKKMRYYSMALSRTSDMDRSRLKENMHIAQKLSEIHKRENARLKRELQRLEEVESSGENRIFIPHIPRAAVFDSSEEEDDESEV